RTTSEFGARQLQARDMLRGDLGGEDLDRYVEGRVMTTTVEKAVAWARGNSFWPLTFGLACCAIEMMSIVGARTDIARFGFEALRASPRQADLIILSGRVSIKMAPVIRRLWDQMLDPKWAISMGACCSSMGVFNNYALVPADKFMPIDVHVPGCPPRPEALMHGILLLRDKIQGHERAGWRDRYEAHGTEELLIGDDYYPEEPRLGVLYELLDMERVDRIAVKARVSSEQPKLRSVVDIWIGADFPEREVYDMFGVVFEGHPDLRRILMPEDYEGFPQRRDFPVGGEPILFTYNEEQSYGKWQ